MEVYLNNAATSWPKPECVYEAVDNYLRHFGASQGRGSFRRSLEATGIMENCRQSLARLFNVDDPKRLVFTKNCSEALNLAFKGLLRPGDHVVTGSMEHNSVWRPLKTLEQKGVITLTQVMCNRQGEIDPADIERAFTSKRGYWSLCTHPTLPARSSRRRNWRGSPMPTMHTSCSMPPRRPASTRSTSANWIWISWPAAGTRGSWGRQGTGALYISPGLKLQPLMEGGTGSNSLSPYQPEMLPDGFETGTPNGPGLAGLGAALEFILSTGVDSIRRKEHWLTGQLLEQLCHIPGVVIYGPDDPDRRVAVVSFNLPEVDPEEVGAALDEAYSVMVRTGLHCSPQAHRTIGTLERGTVRVSPGFFNTPEEISCFIDAVKEIAVKAGQTSFTRREAEAESTGDFVPGYKIRRTSSCHSDPNKIRTIASLPESVEPLLPYLNAVLRGSYHEEGKTFTFSYEKRPVIVGADQITVGKTENIDKVKDTLDHVIKILNKVARERDSIVPSTRPKSQLSPYTIYKHLPRTNCKKCGEMTCLAFATGLIQERCEMAQCPALQEPSREQERQAIQEMLDDYFRGQLPTGEEFVL